MNITMQLRSVTEADAGMPAGADHPDEHGQPASGWVRQMSTSVGGMLLETLGLCATIEWHALQFQRCTGIHCALAMKCEPGLELPERCAAEMFGVYAEALDNVARHAGAVRVAITVTITSREISMRVHDQGIGQGGAAYVGTVVTVSLPSAWEKPRN